MQYFKLHLIRHGLTRGNLEGRYVGSGTDLPLCEQGRADLLALKAQFAYPPAEVVFTSPLQRAVQTAELLYPGVRALPLQDLREMAFGTFENRTMAELAGDPAFAAWMDPHSDQTPPGAESRAVFAARTESLLMKLFEFMIKSHIHEAACITHGGVIMNMLATHALPARPPQDWMTDPGCGYSLRLDAAMWMRDHLAEAYDVAPRGYLDAAETEGPDA